MGDLSQFLAQSTPWVLTVGQTVSIGLMAVVLFVGWVIVHTLLRLGGFIFRIGCAGLLIFICGLASFVVLYNFTNRAN
jgi:hypothetical protein